MAKNVFDRIKDIVAATTIKTPGLVTNLHGVVEDTVVPASTVNDQAWLVLTAPARTLPALREFVDSYTYNRTPYSTLLGQEGKTAYPAQGTLPPGQAAMLLTSVNLSGPTSIPLVVNAGGYDYAVYTDEQKIASGRGVGTHSLRLGAGQHFVCVVLYGGTSQLSVEVPTEYGLSAIEPMPAPPILAGPPTSQYLSAQNGSYQVTVQWGNDSFASSWAVYKTKAESAGQILTMLSNTANSVIKIRISGTLIYIPGEEFYTPKFYGGTILSMTPSTAVVNGQTINTTDVEVAITSDTPVDAASWEGQVFMRSGQFQSLGRVTNSGQSLITLVDSAVEPNALYVYRVTAFSIVTSTLESDYSEAGWVYVTDTIPPGPITIDLANDLRVVNGEVILDYVNPTDGDFKGVKVLLQDALDPSQYSLIASEMGSPGEPDQLSFRPPVAGTYFFCTFDWANNVQSYSNAVSWMWDGKNQWMNAVRGLLISTVQGSTASLDLTVDGTQALFPVTVKLYQDDLSTPMTLAPGVTQYVLSTAGKVDSTIFPSLDAIAVPLSGTVNWWAELTDVEGKKTYAFTNADRGSLPGGSVVLADYQSFPSLTLVYDEDVDKIEVVIPNPSGGTLGAATYVISATPRSGGSTIYDVGDAYTATGGSTAHETKLLAEASRGPYQVFYTSGPNRILIWQGYLHGPSAKEPTIDVRVQMDATLRNAVDVFTTPVSPIGEDVTIEFKTEDDPTLPVWQLVTAVNSTTRKYVTSGTEVSSTEYYKQTVASTWAQKLTAIQLVAGQLKRVFVRAVGKESGVTGPWMVVPLPLNELGEVDGVDLSFDETTDTLFLTGTAGKFTKSVKFEFSDAEDFSANVTASNVNLTTGNKAFASKVLLPGDRGKRWYGRVTAYNGALSSGIPTGIGSVPVRDSEYVWTISGAEPTGTVVLQRDEAGNLTLRVEATQNALSFQYVVNNTGFVTAPTGSTTVTFDGTLKSAIGVGTIAPGVTAYATVWFYEAAGAGGNLGKRVTHSLYFVPAAPPYFGIIQQIKDAVDPVGNKYDIQVQINDPLARGGTFKAWTNKLGTASADPTGPPDGTYSVVSTPVTITPGMLSVLDNVVTNAQTDKFVYFEFVNSSGQSTGVKAVKVTTAFVDIGTDGKLSPGTVDVTNLKSGLNLIKTVSVLPASGNPGDVVVLTTDGHSYTWYAAGSKWVKSIDIPDLVNQIDSTHIKDSALTITKFASGIRPVEILSALPASGNVQGRTVILTTDNKLYRWTGTAWTATVATSDLTGTITNTQITDGSITTPKLVAGVVTANELAAFAVTAGKIAAAAIGVSELAAGAVTASKLAVGFGGGAALNGDPGTSDANAWTTCSVFTISDGKTGTTVLRSTAGAYMIPQDRRLVPVDASKTYRVRCWARGVGANGTFSLLINLMDSSGTSIVGDGTYWLYAGSTNFSGWSLIQGTFGAGTSRPIPTTARTMQVGALMNNGGTAGYYEMQDVRIEEVLPGTLIQDGSITTEKLVAHAVTADKISITQLAALSTDLGIIVSGKLTSQNLTSYLDLNATGTGMFLYSSGNFYIQANGAAYFNGVLGATTVGAINISASQVSVNTLQQFTQNMGIMVQGKLQGYTNSANFLDLNAANTSSAVFLQAGSGALKIFGDGSATFSGTVIVSSLADINSNAGHLVAGYLRNGTSDPTTSTAGIALGAGAALASWTKYISFYASDTYFVYHPKMQLANDGTASFSGKVNLNSATAGPQNWVDLYLNGTAIGRLRSVSGAWGTGSVVVKQDGVEIGMTKSDGSDGTLLRFYDTFGEFTGHLNLYGSFLVNGPNIGSPSVPNYIMFSVDNINPTNANETPATIRFYDGSSYSTRRVLVGPTNSAGTGFRYLRIAN